MWSVFLPVVVLVGLTLTVLGRLPGLRIRDIKADRTVATRGALDTGAYSEASRKHEANLANLFETPVLFYVAAVFAILFGATGWWTGLLCWGYVAARIAHTIVHTTSNVVVRRFGIFLASVVLLALLWLNVILAAHDSPVLRLGEAQAAQADLIEELRDALGTDE